MDHRVGRSGARGVDLASHLLLYFPPALLATIVVELNKGKGGDEMRWKVLKREALLGVAATDSQGAAVVALERAWWEELATVASCPQVAMYG